MNKIFLTLISLLTITNFSVAQKSFKIYNALLYKDTPDLKKYGFSDIYIFYEDDLNHLDKDGYRDEGRIINRSAVIACAKRARLNPDIPVCLDIESWPLDGKFKKESRSKYLSVLKLFKKHNNLSDVGYFGVFPMDSPHADYSFNSSIRETVIMPKWHSTNDYFKEVGRSVDIYFPVFYTRYRDHKTWVKIVLEKVEKIKEVNKNAKIYGFIWPQYYSNDGTFSFIEEDVWQKQLEVLYQYCDGAVVWSHYKGPNGDIQYFSTDMPWFKSTLDFIKSKNIK